MELRTRAAPNSQAGFNPGDTFQAGSLAPEQREKLCISIRMGIRMRGRTLGLEESPPETPLPSPAEHADQPCTTGHSSAHPFSIRAAGEAKPFPTQLQQALPCSPLPALNPQVPPAGGTGAWCGGRDTVVAQGLVYSGKVCWSSFPGTFQLLSLPQQHGCSVANS